MKKIVYTLFLVLIVSCSAPKELDVSRFSDMQVPRQEIAGVEQDKKFYIIGGIYADKKASDAVEVYYPQNDSYYLAPRLPNKIHHVGAVSHDNKIYVIGGFTTENGKFIPVDSVYVFDGNSWTNKSKMPTPRGGLGLAVVDNKIYAIGGADDTKSLSIVEVYNPQTDTWQEHSYMNLARDHLFVAALDEKIYAIGGRESTSWPFRNKGEIEIFENGKWKILETSIKPRSGMGGAVLQNKIFLFGGESAINVFDDFEILENGKIRKAKASLTPRHGMAAIAYENKMYLIGGANKAGYGVTGINEAVIIE